MSLSNIILTLLPLQKSKCTQNSGSTDVKKSAYKDLLSYMSRVDMNKEELQAQSSQIVSAIVQDIQLNDPDTVIVALEVLHKFLKELSVDKVDYSEVLQALLQRARKFLSLDVTILILRCLNHQYFLSDQLIPELLAILDGTEDKHIKTLQYNSIVEETVELLFSLEKKTGDNFRASPTWAFYTIPALATPSSELREKAYDLLNKYCDCLMGIKHLSKRVLKCLNTGMAVSLKKLMQKDQVYVINAWILLMKLVGQEIHKGSTINAMLEIIEIGFKSTPDIRTKAFVAWRSLIDNFALDEKVISDQKRINLIMLVLKIDNAKREDIAREKLLSWWHFIICLGPKLSINIEQIVYPLLQFCLGAASNAKLGTSSSNSKLSSPKTNNSVTSFSSIQMLGFEVLAHLIGKMQSPSDKEQFQWTLEPPKLYEPTSLNFVRHASFIFTTLQELLEAVGPDVNESLLINIWTNIISHVKGVLEANSSPKSRDVFSKCFSLLYFIVHQEKVNAKTAMKMIIESCAFPQKVLAATVYSIACKGGNLIACPAQLLLEILLTPLMIKAFESEKGYVSTVCKLVTEGAGNILGALSFLQQIAEMVTSQASLLQQESLFHIWTEVAQTLQNHLSLTNEVNQGDALEHNFSCMYAVLLQPFKLQLAADLTVSQNKTLLKLWKELYQTFARLSALVTTAEANVCMEEICSKLISLSAVTMSLPEMEFWVSACYQIMESIDFTSLAQKNLLSSGATLSAFKRKQNPLGSLHSIVNLISELQTKANKHVLQRNGTVKKLKEESSVNILNMLVDIYLTLFGRTDGNSYLKTCFERLAKPVADLFKISATDSFKSSHPSLLSKLEKLWREMGACLTSGYTGFLGAELLHIVTPLFQVNFLHASSIIQNETVAIWNSSFGCLSTITYPDSLNGVLTKVKEKKAIKLLGRGWIPCDEDAVIAETPFTEMNMNDSPVSNIMPSPKQQKGSLLSKSPVRKSSPSPKSSPVRVVNAKTLNLLSSARKNIALDFLPKDEFVVISSPSSRKRRILTEHQKEVLKEKCVIPAMYNNLDASQDVSLGAHFIMDTQHDSESTTDNSVSNTALTHQVNGKSVNDPAVNKLTIPRRASVRIRECSSTLTPNIIQDKASNDPLDLKSQKDTKKSSNKQKLKEIVDSKSQKDTNPGPGRQEGKDKEESVSSCEMNSQIGSSNEGESLKKLKPSSSLTIVISETKNGVKNGLTHSLSQDSGLSAMSKSNQKNTSREIKSQDESQSAHCQNQEKIQEPQNLKPPRRVPLQRIGILNVKSNETVLKTESVSTGTGLEDNKSMSKTRTKLFKPKSSDAPHSARKLFPDSNPNSVVEINASVEPKEKEKASQDEDLSSSQGFSPFQSSNQNKSIRGTESIISVAQIAESESLFSCSQNSPTYSVDVMPTLMSPSKCLPNFTTALKSSVEETSTTSSGTSSNKAVSSSESLFNPSQSTLQEDSPKEISKRKNKMPKRYSPINHSLRRGRRKTTNSEITVKSSESKSSNDKNLIDEKCILHSPKTPNDSKKSSIIFVDEDDAVSTKLVKNISPIIGEVTPEVKSPTNVNPTQRRHTAVKRKGRLSKRLARQSMSEGLHGPEIDLDNVGPNELPDTTTILKRKKITKESTPTKTKKSLVRKSISPQIKKMLQLKVKATRCLTSSTGIVTTTRPKKREVVVDSSDDDIIIVPDDEASETSFKKRKSSKTASTKVSRKYVRKSMSPKGIISKIRATRHLASNTEAATPPKKRKISVYSSDDDIPLVYTKLSSVTKGNVEQSNSVLPSSIVPPVEKCVPYDENNSSTKFQLFDEALNRALCKITASVRQAGLKDCFSQKTILSADVPLAENSLASCDAGTILKNSVEDGRADTAQKESLTDEERSVKQDEMHENTNSIIDFVVNDRRQEDANTKKELADPSHSPINEDSNNENSVQEVPACKDNVNESLLTVSEAQAVNANESGSNLINNINDNIQVMEKRPNAIMESITIAEKFPTDDQQSISVQDNGLTADSNSCDQNSAKRKIEEVSGMETTCYDWSPSKSPNVSILKKPASETPPSVQSRRVSFAEPVVSGTSPLRVNYPVERLANSTPREGSKARTSLFSRKLMRSYGNKRRFDTSPRKLNWDKSCDFLKSLESSQQSQTVYKATQESQLSSAGPIFPELVDCKKPLDDILPQLTSSFWYRGLCQLMKGRNLNTIGDLCSLTEVQINQLPFRTPKVQTVKTTLITYMMQHGLSKTKSNQFNETGQEISKDALKSETSSNETVSSALADHQNSGPLVVVKDDEDGARPKFTLVNLHQVLAETKESDLTSLSTAELSEMQIMLLDVLGNVTNALRVKLLN